MDHSTANEALERARREATPPALLEALGELPAYLVGGAVRDALLGRSLGDVDIAIDGDVGPLLERLGVEARSHERFATATITLDGRRIDIARTRRERYAAPGALPEVRPAPVRSDLARRDFTVNALAVPLAGDLELLDPYDGLADIEAGLLRSIHSGSFRDDPTRALRAARYAVRFGLALEPQTEAELRRADLGTVSADRVRAELARIAADPEAVAMLLRLEQWGLLELGVERRELLASIPELLATEPWSSLDRAALLLELATAPAAWLAGAADVARIDPAGRANSELFELASGREDGQLAVARASGATWLDAHRSEWSRVRLSIGGAELLAAGIEEGPELGHGLRAALHAVIDQRIEPGTEAELAAALAAIDADRD